jgi:hypothetical protein
MVAQVVPEEAWYVLPLLTLVPNIRCLAPDVRFRRTHSNSVILSAGNQFACELIQQSKDLAFSLCHSRIREFSPRMQFCRLTGNFPFVTIV